jgi:hypothetical protein
MSDGSITPQEIQFAGDHPEVVAITVGAGVGVVAVPLVIEGGSAAVLSLAVRNPFVARVVGALAGAAKLTQPGEERIGAGSPRGGTLTMAQARVVQLTGTKLTQADGAAVHVVKTAEGRYTVAVSRARRIITSFERMTEKKYEKLAQRFGYH